MSILIGLLLPLVRPLSRRQLILGDRNVVAEVENLANNLLRILAECSREIKVRLTITVREEQFDIARVTQRAQILDLDCDEPPAQII
jgi:hypothetical protein